MKIINALLITFVMALTVACGSSGYNPSVCEKLAEKITNKETLSEKDFNEMIDQIVYIAKISDSTAKEFKENPEKAEEWREQESNKKMLSYALGFTFYLAAHEKDLTPANHKKMEEAEKEVKSLNN